jgi:DNA-binding response OmpR family regulator
MNEDPPQHDGGQMDAEAPPAAETVRGRVLIIDDSKVVLRILKLNFAERGIVAETALDGKAGIELASTHLFDVIVVDGMMPGMDGFEVCQAISGARVGDRPLLVMHSNLYKGFTERARATECGADAFVLKVLDGSPLVEKVLELLSRFLPPDP